MIKNFKGIKPKDKKYKEIAHIISSLYKIKSINRKIIYDDDELKSLVMTSIIGQQVIEKLKEMKITRITLLEYGFKFFDRILGDNFKEY